MAEYGGRLPLFHQDLYRLAGADEILAGGLLDERQYEGVTLSEWGERLPATLDPDRLTVRIEIPAEDERRISVEPALPTHVRYIEVATAWRP
jgi:tRNA threonylcarbamoyladenosine biosynthesis protein TsaE